MRATIKNYLDAAKQRREENGEAGFSLIELIVVVAILGILVAIAIPVFGAIQQNAKDTALKNAASSGAVVAASEFAAGRNFAAAAAQVAASSTADYNLTLNAGATSADNVCVTASATGGSLNGATAQAAGSAEPCTASVAVVP